MGEEFRVSEVLEARGVVRNDVQRSRKVVGVVAIAVLPLMRALEVAEMGSGSLVGNRSFRHAGDCRDVVTPGGDGGVAGVEVVGLHHGLAN